MSDEAHRTLWSREIGGRLELSDFARSPGEAEDPTSWNGISYDGVMRTLEDAMSSNEWPTLVRELPATQPTAFSPVGTTQRMPRALGPAHDGVARDVTSIAPVAMPSMTPSHGGDAEIHRVATPRPRRGRFLVAAVAVGVLVAVASFTQADQVARAPLTNHARAHVSGWVTRLTATSSNESRAPAAATPPPAPLPVAPVAADAAVAADTSSVPEMRAPTPPARRVTTKAKRIAATDDEASETVADPSSLLDRGLGE